MTNENERVTIVTILNNDSSKLNNNDFLKMIYMITEIRTIEDYNMADVGIFDLQNITASHAVKWTLPTIKKTEVLFFVSSEKNCVLSKSYNLSYLQS